jgi:eukaryotic-like serine/threonine-protein kinase
MAKLNADNSLGDVVGRSLGHYEIRARLGAGGMGEVYLAIDERLGRQIALKLLPSQFTKDQERLRRFQQEARAASALNHPNILTIYEIGEANDHHFLATELIEGETLRAQLKRAPMKIGEALDVAAQCASALAAAHAAGIIHRDIKPENIMVRHDGYVKILDFGLAKLTERPDVSSEDSTLVNTGAGVVMGTPAYMSPEQARGQKVDACSDLWSLGVVLYEMVGGRVPFTGETASDVISLILRDEPLPLTRIAPEVPTELEWIVKKALRKDPEERYQTAKELLTDLKNLKQRLDFEAELERTVQPESRSGAIAATGGAQTTIETAKQSTMHSTSSAEYVVSEIKKHKRGAVIALAMIIAAAVAALVYFNRAPALTERDTILLADFVNTTGDAVFDGTLRQALAVQLGQSPYLNIIPEDRVRETLRYMGRSPDQRITRDVGREICERQGIKALLVGSISALGNHYVITLEAINAQSGEALAREQAEAESKEQVLRSLGAAAVQLRERLGESLASIRRFDAPIEQATTSSLEALRAFALGDEQRNRGDELEAIPFYRRAIELDPNFALAHARLAVVYSNNGQLDRANEASQRAFELRDRVSERERFYITEKYYSNVTGEIDRRIETLELWKRTYPNDATPRNNLAVTFLFIGQYERAIEEAREAMRLNPNLATPASNLSGAFMSLNRYDEARQVLEQALAQRPNAPVYHRDLYGLAFVRGDNAEMEGRLAWFAGRPVEHVAYRLRAETAAFGGRFRQAREFNRRAIELLRNRNLNDNAAQAMTYAAMVEAVVGNCQEARATASAGLAIERTLFSLNDAAFVYALCGDAAQAQPIADDLARRRPQDTALNAISLPMTRAALELSRGNGAQAVQLLQLTSRYESGLIAGFWPNYLRGQALLRQQAGAEAMAEFQKILDRRGVSITSPLYPLAHLGLARAAALTGDTARSRRAYQDFFALWRDADSDIPILQEARQEYERLR